MISEGDKVIFEGQQAPGKVGYTDSEISQVFFSDTQELETVDTQFLLPFYKALEGYFLIPRTAYFWMRKLF